MNSKTQAVMLELLTKILLVNKEILLNMGHRVDIEFRDDIDEAVFEAEHQIHYLESEYSE